MRGVREEQLIKKNEKVAVAVSGGKDSITLAYLLKKLQQRYPFQMEAIIIDEGISGYRNLTLDAAKAQLEMLEISYHIESFKDFSIGPWIHLWKTTRKTLVLRVVFYEDIY